jgi:spore coat polysaccharide biosynthesis protein SpsF
MVLGILQARMSSSRLPGKVLKPILGAPMLQRQIERLKRAARIDRLVVATSVEQDDAAIVQLCRKIDVECFRGNLTDVLDRFYQCAAGYSPDAVVRTTGDCPLIDPSVVDACVEHFGANVFDYVSNSLQRTFPDGLDVEVFSFAALERAWKEAQLPSEREHVTPYIYNNPDKFKISQFVSPVDLSGPRWTVDELPDYEFVCRVYEALYPKRPNFDMQDVFELVRARPELKDINSHLESGAGYMRSLEEDATFLASREKTS